MTIASVTIVFLLYFMLLIAISRITTGRHSANDTFFTGDRKSPWIIVAYGMIGTLLSGVTFMSVPGYVRESQFTYLGVVLGNFVGVFVIAFLLLPTYYRLFGYHFGFEILLLNAFITFIGLLIFSRPEKNLSA